MPFIHENFLLHSPQAIRLYNEFAKPEPIYDYHCHLVPSEIAADKRFENLFDIWLAGDHYKWRAMRSNGVAEKFCTGDADPYDKFLAYVETVPHTLRNPLYHWSHLELKRYFDIELSINPDNAKTIWDTANEKLQSQGFSVHGILKKFDVRLVCTTDDPADSLESHESIRKSGISTKVYPAFRPDKALLVNKPVDFNAWRKLLAEAAGIPTDTFAGLLAALDKRHEDFHEFGARVSDHGLDHAFAEETDAATAAAIFDAAVHGHAASQTDHAVYASYLMIFFGELDAKRGWVKQLHLGALRSNNTRMLKQAGPDTGFDSIGDDAQARSLSRYLDALDQKSSLPKTILYNLNPRDNYLLGTMIGNFQDGSVPGKMQFGSGWWFLDQKEAMTWQINALSNLGLLSRFVGMLTDSRSFLSYPRHEYFRRILCNILGEDMVKGEIPEDFELVGQMVRNICYHNAAEYFGMEL